MERVAFGPTGLQVTRLCWGTAALGDMPETFAYEVPTEQGLATVRAMFDSAQAHHPPRADADAGAETEEGVNFIDTAASYGDGESERRIGLVLRELGGLPPGLVLATKADRDLHSGDFSGDQIRRSVERSLRLLGLDRLQIVYLHDPEHTTFEAAMAPGGPVEVLLDFTRQGVIEHIGVAGGPIPLMTRFVETGAFDAVISHNRYTLLSRLASPLFDVAHQRGMAVVNAAPYGSGILAKGPDAYARYAYQDASPEMVQRTRRLAEECSRAGVPLPAAALQFSMRDPRITSTIVGVSRPERIQQTLELARTRIPDELWARLEGIALAGSEEDPESHRWAS